MRKSSKSKPRKGRGPGLNKRPDRIETENKLLEAGVSVFSEFGFEGSSVQKISEKSGVNVSLINRYFGSKEGLLYAIARHYAQNDNSRIYNYPAQDSVYKELLEYTKADFEYTLTLKNILRVLIGKASVDEKFRKEMFASIPLDQVDPFLDGRLKALQRAGKIRKEIDLEEVQLVLGLQLFSTTFLTYMILDFDKAQTLAVLKSFVETYSRGLV